MLVKRKMVSIQTQKGKRQYYRKKSHSTMTKDSTTKKVKFF